MRRSKFSRDQKLAILEEARKAPQLSAVLGRHGISRATLYRWRKELAEVSRDQHEALRREIQRLRKALGLPPRTAPEPPRGGRSRGRGEKH